MAYRYAYSVSCVGAAALMSASSMFSVAHAQSIGDVGSQGLETVTITATRVARDGYSAPTPTVVVGSEEILSQAPLNIADVVNELPALMGSSTPTSVNAQGGNQVGQNILNLRSLGLNRTLVLLDGQRITPNTATGNIDTNLLPSALIQRIDVVTGGASADWGSDAVAGVVNFVLNKNFNGLKGEVQAGETEYSDGKNIGGDLTFGTPFAADKGHFEISGQYLNQAAVAGAAVTGRSWYQGWNIIGNPNGSATDVLASNVGYSLQTAGGLITAGPLKYTQFVGASGTPATFSPGFVSGSLSVNGSAQSQGGQLQLMPFIQEGSLYSRASYDLSPDVTVYADGTYSKSLLVSQSTHYARQGNVTILSGNPFIPPSVQAAMTSGNIASFSLGTFNAGLPLFVTHNSDEVASFDVGAEGRFGDGWTWDARYQHGVFHQDAVGTGDPIVANYNLATDAVISPTTGAIVCRSTLTNPTNGCAPLDPFGTGNVSPAAQSYIEGQHYYGLTTGQNDFTANVKGTPISLWAGPISLAAGGEYREEKFNLTSGALDISNSLYLGNQLPANGSFNVTEGYVEAVVPLLSGIPLAKELDLNAAVRETSYSASGAVTTWKVGLTYDVNDDIRLRTTRSTDIRAPNLQDIFATGLTVANTISDPVTGTSGSIQVVTSGNPQLKPEVAHTTSGGAVYTPHWVPGLEMSVDYSGVNITNAITSLTGQQIVTQCFAGITAACPLITRGNNNLITLIHAAPVNAQSETTSAIDLALNYRKDVADVIPGWDGTLTIAARATDTMDHTICVLGQCIQYAGTNGDGQYADVRWRGLLSATYDKGPLSATLIARYVGSGDISNRTPLIVNNNVPQTVYLDVSAFYNVDEKVQVYFKIANLTDQNPPPTPQIASMPATNMGANNYIYDVLGRQFRIGFRFNY